MKILIAILKTCGNRMEKTEPLVKKEEKQTKTFDDRMLKFINSPNRRIMRIWHVITSVFYLEGLFHDSLLIAFRMYLVLEPGVKLFLTIRAMIMLLDIISTFMTAIPKEVKLKLNDSHDDPMIRKRER